MWGPASDIWTFTAFPSPTSTSVAYSWLVTISKFLITRLYSSSLPGLLSKVPSKGLGACPGNQPGEPSLHITWQIFKSSLLYLLKCQNSLLHRCQFCYQLFAWLNLTQPSESQKACLPNSLNLQPGTCLRCQLPCGWVYRQVLVPSMSLFWWKELTCATKPQR